MNQIAGCGFALLTGITAVTGTPTTGASASPPKVASSMATTASATLSASAPPASAAAVTPTTTCSVTGPIQGLKVRACVDVTRNRVRIYGTVGALGISEPPGVPRNVRATVSGEIVGGAFLGSRSRALSIWNDSFTVEGTTATVTCGSTVRATVVIEPGPPGPGGGGPLPGPTSVSVDVPVIY
ncbi:hypothetical protein AB0395_08710 [Streptosporangium sp. NPDC051023]|uniref:hypothetical protein n=1 Tax=Streptosporangium sp. NPDC051023 TaxID=3155410 RepID=UPI00344CC057